ncbi:MAG: endo-1,4-beta-xylanase [Oscillospiraceae bacterium]|nr:endo-1,4-beta-xylanase [Oscillospiraceae bacterium]
MKKRILSCVMAVFVYFSLMPFTVTESTENKTDNKISSQTKKPQVTDTQNNDSSVIDSSYELNIPESSDSLKDKFSSFFKTGTCISASGIDTSAEFILKHFNSITPENELKPDYILNQQASELYGNNVNTQVVFNNNTRKILKFCEDNNIPLRGHTFVWHSQTPDWFFKENFRYDGADVTPDIMNQRLENFIKNTFELLAKDYPNLKIYAYDVCNELYENNGGGFRKPGSNNLEMGKSYWTKIYPDDSFVINAFTYARKYAPPECKLFLNDFNEYVPAKTKDIYDMAMKLKDLGLIDGIGMQSHLDTGYPDISTYKTALEKFISSGLDVQITELDITCSDFSLQAKAFKDIFTLAAGNSENISSLTVWGTHDTVSWRNYANPLLFGENYSEKEAYKEVMSIKNTDLK